MKNSGCWLLLAILFCGQVSVSAQTPTQRISGTVLDKASRQPLPGANVFITLNNDKASIIGTVSDQEGRFTLDKVPVGRHYLNCSYVSYENWISPYLELTSAKQLNITIELNE
ncbi:MAG TPA: carboxypeptidase-like regulatory domain-containing protein, partial [Cyclobacteriaceae bacterium]|nr:carboxypeptidase-like regulatory domain-containing protein [Cyclobacteriaceae bacterium]